MHRSTSGALTSLAAAVLLAVVPAVAANAHVGVDPVSAEPGETATVTFTVPNESEVAATSSVEITLPLDSPLVNVRYQPIAGWTGVIREEALPEPVTVGETLITTAPTRIIFTANPGGGIKPFEFETFTVRLGPVPEVDRLVLPIVQTYDDGEVSNWSASPEEYDADNQLSPAPVVYVQAEPPVGGHDSPASTESTTPTEATGDTNLAFGIGVAGLALGASALVLAIIALRRGRKAAA